MAVCCSGTDTHVAVLPLLPGMPCEALLTASMSAENQQHVAGRVPTDGDILLSLLTAVPQQATSTAGLSSSAYQCAPVAGLAIFDFAFTKLKLPMRPTGQVQEMVATAAYA